LGPQQRRFRIKSRPTSPKERMKRN